MGVAVKHMGGFYQDVELEGAWATADAVLAFQPGIWGYDSWEPAIRRALGLKVPLLVTSYNAMEAEDDMDSLESMGLSQGHWQSPGWEPEENPNAAGSSWTSISNPGRAMREQYYKAHPNWRQAKSHDGAGTQAHTTNGCGVELPY